MRKRDWRGNKNKSPHPDVVNTRACKQMRVAFTEAQKHVMRPALAKHHRVRDTRARFTRRLLRGGAEQQIDELHEDYGTEYIQPGRGPRFHERSNDERRNSARPGIAQQYYKHKDENDVAPDERAAARARAWLHSENAKRQTCCTVHSQQVLVITLECAFKVHLRYTTCTRYANASPCCLLI